jgi:putative transposase
VIGAREAREGRTLPRCWPPPWRANGERRRFSSAILPPWCRKSPKAGEVLPLLYLHGLSSGDFVPALEQFLGTSAGLSPATVTRLTVQWQADHTAFRYRDLSATDYVYVWADGVHLRVRLEEAEAAVVVLMGVRADGTKELIAMSDGYRESSAAWAGLLRDCVRRGMRAPVPAVGDGALGFWNALSEVFPMTRYQRCWVPKPQLSGRAAEVRAVGAKCAIQEICNAEETVGDAAPCIEVERYGRRPVANLNAPSAESVARSVCGLVRITATLKFGPRRRHSRVRSGRR